MVESLLKQQFGGAYVILDQLDRIISLARHRLVDLAVLPNNVNFDSAYGLDAVIYMAPHEAADNLVIKSDRRRPIENQVVVQQHIDQFRAYQGHSLRGDQAIEFVEGLAREMSDGQTRPGDPAAGRDGG